MLSLWTVFEGPPVSFRIAAEQEDSGGFNIELYIYSIYQIIHVILQVCMCTLKLDTHNNP